MNTIQPILIQERQISRISLHEQHLVGRTSKNLKLLDVLPNN